MTNSVKGQVRDLLETLPEDRSIEDIQYHLYVIDKIRQSMEVVDRQGAISQEEAEARSHPWMVE